MEFAIEIDALPYCTIEGRVEVILTDPPQRATWWEPGHGGGVELGTIEQITGHHEGADGKTVWHYAPFKNDELGKLLEQAVRDTLEADDDFIADCITEALEEAASEREEAMERRWAERHEMQRIDGP